jgi:hypothetical protein
MDNIRNTAKLVKEVLLNDKMARNSDNYLYYIICKAKLKGLGIDIKSLSLQDGLLHRSEYGLPAFETVRRSRQKIQADNPALAGTAEIEAIRMIREESFREFARSGEIG